MVAEDVITVLVIGIVFVLVGWVLKRARNREEGIKMSLHGLELEADEAYIGKKLGEVGKKLGKNDEALRAIREAFHRSGFQCDEGNEAAAAEMFCRSYRSFLSAYSSYSGWSGRSGTGCSEYSGWSGWSGGRERWFRYLFGGISGYSGFSGTSEFSGTSGFSGTEISGTSGWMGKAE